MRDPIKPGGMRDPVAQSIRNEMNRDAAPSPEEAERDHLRWLERQGCEFCEETDPERLNMAHVEDHHCREHQSAGYQSVVYCDDCGWDYEFYRISEMVRDDKDGLVYYHCGVGEYFEQPEQEYETINHKVGWDEEGEPIYEERQIPSRFEKQPEAPVRCRCGVGVKYVIYF